MKKQLKFCDVQFGQERSFIFDHVHIVWDEQISLHKSPSWELSYVITGSGLRTLGHVTEAFRAGEVVLIPPQLMHGWAFNKNDHDDRGKIENISIFFDTSLLDKMLFAFPETAETVRNLKEMQEAILPEQETLEAIQQTLLRMCRQNQSQQLFSLLNMLEQLATAPHLRMVPQDVQAVKTDSKAERISRFIINHYHRKITVDEAAGYMHMNKSSFCSFFKREKGVSFLTALTDYRLSSACLMLTDTDMSVAQICGAVGFDDVPHFNRTFRKIKGMTPTEYRHNQPGKRV